MNQLWTLSLPLTDGPVNPDEVWARVQAYSAAAKRLETNFGPYDDFLSPALRDHLGGFVLAMQIGQSAG